jgi:hypothetical protein
VHRYFRREAIRALAQFRLPAVEIDAKNKKIDGPVAYWLLKVVANDGLSPSASVSEQVEAAYGLFLLRSEGTPYQTDLSLYVAGRFIAKVFAVKYNIDHQRAAKGIEVKLKKKDKKERSAEPIPVREEPWTLHAARLSYAMGEQVVLATGTTKSNMAKLQGKAKLIFDPMAISFTSKATKQVSPEDITQLGSLVDETLKPAQMSAYLGYESYTVKVGAEE